MMINECMNVIFRLPVVVVVVVVVVDAVVAVDVVVVGSISDVSRSL